MFVDQLDEQTVRLTVTVPVETVDAAIDEAYKRMAKKIKIPGFRAGKAPKPVIDTHVGRDAVLGDAQDDVLTESYTKALDAEGIRPIQQPEMDELDLMQPGKAFEYVAEVAVRPELTLSSIEGLSIEVPSAEASDEEVDVQIDYMRDRFATLEPVEDRGIEEGDFVLLSFVGLVDGEDYEGNEVDKYLYEMSTGLMPPEFEEALIGAKPGDEAKAEFVIPKTSSTLEFIGKNATFDITVHEIKKKILPELDDELAMDAGGYESAEEMRSSIKADIDRNKAIGRAQAHERGVREVLAERLEGEIPDAMIQSTSEQMKRDFLSSLQDREMTIEQYVQNTGISGEEVEADIAEQAEASVRQELALEALFRLQGFEITEEDIDETLRETTSDSDSSAEELREKWESAGIMIVLHEQISHKKAVGWLMDAKNVEVIEKDDATAEGDESSDEVEE